MFCRSLVFLWSFILLAIVFPVLLLLAIVFPVLLLLTIVFLVLLLLAIVFPVLLLLAIVFPVLLLLAIVFPVLLRYADSGYPFGIFKLFYILLYFVGSVLLIFLVFGVVGFFCPRPVCCVPNVACVPGLSFRFSLTFIHTYLGFSLLI